VLFYFFAAASATDFKSASPLSNLAANHLSQSMEKPDRLGHEFIFPDMLQRYLTVWLLRFEGEFRRAGALEGLQEFEPEPHELVRRLSVIVNAAFRRTLLSRPPVDGADSRRWAS